MGLGEISALWIGSALGPLESTCLSSFTREGFEVNLYTYEQTLEVPDGISVLDAADIVPKADAFENRDRPGTFAAFSDVFRYRLLSSVKTTWVDTDVLCLTDSLPGGEYLLGWEDQNHVNGAILRAPRDSEFLQFCESAVQSADLASVSWGAIGPALVTRAVETCGLAPIVLPTQALYPIHFSRIWEVFDPSRTKALENYFRESSTLHLWNEVLRRFPDLKTRRPPRGSFMEMHFERAGVLSRLGPELELDWVRKVFRRGIDPRYSMRGRIRSSLASIRTGFQGGGGT